MKRATTSIPNLDNKAAVADGRHCASSIVLLGNKMSLAARNLRMHFTVGTSSE